MKRQKCEEEMMQEMEPETDKKFIEKKKTRGRENSLSKEEQQQKNLNRKMEYTKQRKQQYAKTTRDFTKKEQ